MVALALAARLPVGSVSVSWREDRTEWKRLYMREYRRGLRRTTGKRSVLVRILDKLERDPGELVVAELGPCWPWRGARNADGYGIVRDNAGQLVLVHRVTLSAALGRPIAAGMWACHRCDNRPCGRPAHLYEGTPSDNVQDTWDRGRSRREPIEIAS